MTKIEENKSEQPYLVLGNAPSVTLAKIVNKLWEDHRDNPHLEVPGLENCPSGSLPHLLWAPAAAVSEARWDLLRTVRSEFPPLLVPLGSVVNTSIEALRILFPVLNFHYLGQGLSQGPEYNQVKAPSIITRLSTPRYVLDVDFIRWDEQLIWLTWSLMSPVRRNLDQFSPSSQYLLQDLRLGLDLKGPMVEMWLRLLLTPNPATETNA